MNELPLRGRVYWAFVVGAGIGVTIHSAISAAAEQIDWTATALLFFAGLATQTLLIPFSYRRTRNTQTGTLASAFYVASFLLLSPGVCVIVNTLSLMLAWVGLRRPWYKHIFNMAQYALALGVAGWVWHVGGSGSGIMRMPDDVLPLLLAVGLYFILNTGLVSLMVALVDGLPLRYVWLRSHKHILPAYFGMLFSGVLIANLWSNAQWSVFLAVVPLVAIYYAFRHSIELEQQTLSALFHLADILDQRDYYTHQHSARVGEEAEKLALRLGAPADEAYLIYLCGRLHDIGKCAVNNEVLLKPGPLDEWERQHMCRHPVVGGQMLATFSFFRTGARYVRGHHEWFDGTGYPDGLGGTDIPFGARVIAVADAWDAMTSDRPYRLALPYAEAVKRMQAGRGIQWDPTIVEAYFELVAERRGSMRETPVHSQPPQAVLEAAAKT